MSGKTLLSDSMMEIIFPHGVRNIDREMFFTILKQLEDSTTSPEYRNSIITGLPNVVNLDLIELLLQSLLIENGKKLEDFTVNYQENERRYILQSIISSDPNRIDMVLEFITDNFEQIMKL